MIGRGAMGNPWIFSQIRAAICKEEIISPSVSECLDTAVCQLRTMIEHKGERVGMAEGKKHVCWYLAGLRGSAEARDAIMRAPDVDQIKNILNEILIENQGEEK